jgi:hypothetical protein
MGIMDTVFGDAGGGIANPKTAKLTRRLSNKLLNEFGEGAEVYGGDLVAGTNANIENALGGASGLLYQDPQIQAGLSQLLAGPGDGQAVRDYYQSSVIDPATLAFQDQMQQIGDTYGNTWGTSGAFPRMAADATARFGTGIGSVLGELVYNDRNASLDRIGQGVQGSLAAQQNQAGMLNQVLGMGDYERGLVGEENQANYSQWLSGQDYNNPWLGFLGTALSTATPQAPQSGLLDKAGAIYGMTPGGRLQGF